MCMYVNSRDVCLALKDAVEFSFVPLFFGSAFFGVVAGIFLALDTRVGFISRQRST